MHKQQINYLKRQLDLTQRWLEDESAVRPDFVVLMVIKGMIETERLMEAYEELDKKERGERG